jgi:hypothetical protein
VLENRYKTASTTEEHDYFTTTSSMADKTTADNPEVGTLDMFLSQNTAELDTFLSQNTLKIR